MTTAFAGEATVIFARRIKPGREATYGAWVEDFQKASRDVPGFLGASTIGRGAVADEYVSIVRFASFEQLDAWEHSDLRHEWMAKLPPDTVAGEADMRRLEGFEFWFTAPGIHASVAPSPHKMAIVVFTIVTVLVTIFTVTLRPLVGGAPLLIRIPIMAALQVGLMTYLIMPRVTRLLAGWLFKP